LKQGSRNRKTGVYIGSLMPFKNASELLAAIPLLLKASQTERFIVVGPGPYASDIQRLTSRYGPRLEYIPSLSRFDALRLLASCGYAYTPVRNCGLGFIGDAWGCGAPLVTTHDLDGFLRKQRDTLVADRVSDLPAVVDGLLESDTLFSRLQAEGHSRYVLDHSAEAVGKQYLDVLNEVLDAPDVCVRTREDATRS
jgi:glycosyltransferase involved in cell wall biosynthesis